MARLPRLVIPRHPHLINQRGIDNQAIFREAADYEAYLGWLREASRKFQVAIHAYALLPSQVMLLATPADIEGLGRMMQWVGRHYVPFFNRKTARSGTLWQGRFKAAVVEAEAFLLLCSRYIESYPSNPGPAGSASTTEDSGPVAEYPWSSFFHHTGLRPDPLITDHALYWSLGNTPFDREAAYKDLIEQPLTSEQIDLLEARIRSGSVLGSENFVRTLQKQTSRQVGPAPRGRPSKSQKAVT